jgi:hypothetical protein
VQKDTAIAPLDDNYRIDHARHPAQQHDPVALLEVP